MPRLPRLRRTGTNLAIAKVPGLENPADIVTKYLNSEAAQRHLDKLHVTRSCGRAETAPVLAAVVWVADTPEAAVVDKRLRGERSKDGWAEEAAEGEMVRIHRRPRRELFTPLRVSGAPPAKALATLRVTCGRFAVSGCAFRIVDRWTARAGAHRDLGQAWTGTTTFVKMSEVRSSKQVAPAMLFSQLGKRRDVGGTILQAGCSSDAVFTAGQRKIPSDAVFTAGRRYNSSAK